MKYVPILINLLASITIAVAFPLIQSNCHAGRTGVQEAIGIDTLPNENAGIKLMDADPQQITSITWTNRASTIHVINKEDDEWYYAGMEALDQHKLEMYVKTIAEARGRDVVEYIERPADEKIIIEGKGLMKPVIISVYRLQSNRYLLHTTHVPEISFISDSSGLYQQIFSNLKALWP